MNIGPGSVASAANKITVAAGGTALYGGWTANELAAFGGVLIAMIGLAVQWYYKRKDDRRNEALYRARMADLSDEGS